MAETMIQAEGLVKIYKSKQTEVLALQGLDLVVEKGELTALIGNSGSGKSTAAEVFAEFGAAIIDADRISHEITDSDATVLAKIRQEFSEDVFENGILCRKKLGKIVFSDKEALKKLNSILHPAIAEKILAIIKNSTRKCKS